MIIEELQPRHFESWARLFDACGNGCFCRYWHFSGDKNAWLDRSVNEPRRNREEQERDVRAQDPRGRGLVAIAEEQAIGWMKLAPRPALSKLTNLNVYRAHKLADGDESVWSIACMLVHPSHRGAGVARALIEAAPEWARNVGASSLEAYPRVIASRFPDEQLWMGPASVFLSLGFRSVAGEDPYPVLRLEL